MEWWSDGVMGWPEGEELPDCMVAGLQGWGMRPAGGLRLRLRLGSRLRLRDFGFAFDQDRGGWIQDRTGDKRQTSRKQLQGSSKHRTSPAVFGRAVSSELKFGFSTGQAWRDFKFRRELGSATA